MTTVALSGCSTSRTDESATPTVTTSRTRSFLPSISTGSVVADATSRTWLSGPTTSTVDGSAEIRPTTNPGAGSPSVAGTIGTMRRIDFSIDSEIVGGIDLRDVDAVRHADFVGAQVEQPRPGARRRQIEHRHDVAGIEAAQLRRRSAHADVHRLGQVADNLEGRRQVAHRQRHAQAALDDVLAGDGEPEDAREHDREHLQAEMAERMVRHQCS